MVTRPDYGLYLLSQGYSKKMSQYFYSLPIDHISLVSNRLFSVMNNLAVDGVEYAASFDFDIGLLSSVVALAPDHIQREILGALKGSFRVPGTIELSQPFVIGVEAVLGDEQTANNNEEFVPLVVRNVFAAAR